MASKNDGTIEELVAGAATLYGKDFIREIPRLLAQSLGVKFVFIGEVLPPDNIRVNALSFWAGDKFVEDYGYELPNTPCENVFGKESCSYPNKVQKLFPLDEDLQVFGIIGYAGVPLFSVTGDALGLLVVLDDKPIEDMDKVERTLVQYAPRVGAELEHMYSYRTIEATENRFAHILEQTSAGIAITDSEGHLIRNNESLETFLDYPHQGLLNKHFSILGHPEDLKKEQELTAQLLAGDTNHYRLEKRFFTREGDVVWGDLSISAIRDEAGKLTNFVGVIVDLSRRKKAEDALKESEKKYRDLYDNAPDMYGSVDAQTGNVSQCNQMLATKLGLSKDEIIGQPVFNLYHSDSQEKATEIFREFVEKGQVECDELFLLKKGGEKLPVSLRVSATRDENGEICYSRSIWRDITDLRITEIHLLDAKEEAENANKAKSEFLASMSHELRTPLNAVLGFSQMLQFDTKHPLSPAQKVHVESILEGGAHLLELINKILDLSKIEAHQLDLSIEKVNANEEIADCVAMTGHLGDQRRIKIVNQFNSNKSTYLQTDRLRLKQVLLNLLSNAIKFNNDGGTVSVYGQETDDNFLRISIKDTGVGISKEDYASIFHMFHRLGADPMIAREGTGIGLTVTNLLIERLGGRLGLESEKGIGSTFWIELPLSSNEEASK